MALSKPKIKKKGALMGAQKKTKISKGKQSKVKTVIAKGPSGAELRAALVDILGASPKEIVVEVEEKLGPGGIRIMPNEPTWDGNLYKYRY